MTPFFDHIDRVKALAVASRFDAALRLIQRIKDLQVSAPHQLLQAEHIHYRPQHVDNEGTGELLSTNSASPGLVIYLDAYS